MAFHALIAVPLSAERPGGPWAGAGPVAPVPPQPGIAREFTIRTPAHPIPACQWPSGQPLPRITVGRPKVIRARGRHVRTADSGDRLDRAAVGRGSGTNTPGPM